MTFALAGLEKMDLFKYAQKSPFESNEILRKVMSENFCRKEMKHDICHFDYETLYGHTRNSISFEFFQTQ